MYSSMIPREVSVQGVFAQGMGVSGGVCRGVCPGGGCAQGVYTALDPEADTPLCPLHAGIYIPLPVERILDACENITFPQLLLRAVIRARHSRVQGARVTV